MALVVIRAAAAAGVLALCAGTSAQAHLGGSASTVAADRAALGAAGGASADGAAQRHLLSLGGAGELREYSDPQGRVFAVSWETVGRPDLRQLLGPRLFAEYQGRAAAAGRRGHRALRMGGRSDDLVVQASGRPGDFAGFAYVPSLLPAGFTAAELK